MKKKIVFISMIALCLLGITFFKPKEIFASCFNMSGSITPCTTGHHWCSAGSTIDPVFHFGTTYCCDTVPECQQIIQGNTAATNNLIGQTDPTCSGGTGIDTAVGCIPFNTPDAFVGNIFLWAVGIGGGIAFLLIVYAGFLIMTSAGNPERLQGGKELMTSAIEGLVLLILSVFVLKVLGVNILKLPGFGTFQSGSGSGSVRLK